MAARENSDRETMDEIFRRATEIARTAAEATFSEICTVLERLVPFGEEAFDRAAALLGGDNDQPSVGLEALSVLYTPDINGRRHRVAHLATELAGRVTDTDVQWSIAGTLGAAHDPLGIAALASLADHKDADVRWKVVTALPNCVAGARSGEVQAAVAVLLARMTDPDEDVRDWATFAIGTLLPVDGPEVRAALSNRLHDDHVETRFEALVGLACRHDSRALPITIECLRTEAVHTLAVKSAEYLAAPALLEDLRALQAWWDVDTELLASAISRCDPRAQQEKLDWMAGLAMVLQDSLETPPGGEGTFGCDLGPDQGAWLTIGQERQWDLDGLRQRTGTTAQAVDAILSDLGA